MAKLRIKSDILFTAGLGKGILVLIGITCFILMFIIKYDSCFKIAILLPISYTLIISFFIERKQTEFGVCTSAILFFYAFRMCIQPVILALGNFWLETNPDIYMPYFNDAIYLTCFEFIVVVATLKYYVNYYSIQSMIFKRERTLCKNNHNFYRNTVILLTVLVFGIIFIFRVHYFFPLWEELNLEVVAYRLETMSLDRWYYIVDLAATWWRPLVTFWLVYILFKKYRNKAYWAVFFIALLNFTFPSERRIYSIIVGGICLYYMMALFKTKKVRMLTGLMLGAGVIMVGYVLFYNYSIEGGNRMIARTVTRYFSGPTLTAMNLQMNEHIGWQPFEFIKLLLNDFQIFTSLVGRLEVPNYYQQYYGMSKGLWTPFVVGSIRYFSVLFPIIIVLLTKFVVRMDYKSRLSGSILYKMTYSYLGIVTSCYMVMYKLELIVYFILSTGILFFILIKCDKKQAIC